MRVQVFVSVCVRDHCCLKEDVLRVCVCACVRVSLCAHVCVCMFTCIFACVYMCVCLCVCVRVCACVPARARANWVCVHVYARARVCIQSE